MMTTLTLVDLASPNLVRQLVADAVDRGADRRTAAIELLHVACRLAVVSMLAPMVDRGEHTSPEAAVTVGRRMMEAVSPVIDNVASTAPAPSRALRNVVHESLRGAALRLARHHPNDGAEWVRTLLEGAGSPSRLMDRSITVDAGDATVDLPLPRTCCVLAASVGPDACPTCPLHADDERRRALTEEWLGDLDDTEFIEIVGRARITHRSR